VGKSLKASYPPHEVMKSEKYDNRTPSLANVFDI
jgi:hypothetical protein